MLNTYLTTLPYTKFILIEDSLVEKGKDLFEYVVKRQSKRAARLHFVVCEGIFQRTHTQYKQNNITFYDVVSNQLNWTKQPNITLEDMNKDVKEDDVFIIDSIAHASHLFGLSHIIRFLNGLIQDKGVQQIITLLHNDLLVEKQSRSIFEHLCTLSIRVKPKVFTDRRRIKYRYKKTGGKMVTQVEEYNIENDVLNTFKIERPEAEVVEQAVANSVEPEKLATFRIGLTEAEKESKEQVVLPYLPKGEGKITYTMEEIDDWDEEDPDDDLDI